MSTIKDATRARATEQLETLVQAEKLLPWANPKTLVAGLPRSGASGNRYTGISTWILWAHAAAIGYSSPVWFTVKAAQRAGGALREDHEIVKIPGTSLVNVDAVDNLEFPTPEANNELAVERVNDLVNFLGIPVRSGRTAGYSQNTGAIHIPAPKDFDSPAQRAATILAKVILWTRDERRIDRETDEIEDVIEILGSALLATALRLGAAAVTDVDWAQLFSEKPQNFWDAIPYAERAAEYVLHLVHPDLATEISALRDGDTPERPVGAGIAADLITSLGQML